MPGTDDLNVSSTTPILLDARERRSRHGSRDIQRFVTATQTEVPTSSAMTNADIFLAWAVPVLERPRGEAVHLQGDGCPPREQSWCWTLEVERWVRSHETRSRAARSAERSGLYAGGPAGPEPLGDRPGSRRPAGRASPGRSRSEVQRLLAAELRADRNRRSGSDLPRGRSCG